MAALRRQRDTARLAYETLAERREIWLAEQAQAATNGTIEILDEARIATVSKKRGLLLAHRCRPRLLAARRNGRVPPGFGRPAHAWDRLDRRAVRKADHRHDTSIVGFVKPAFDPGVVVIRTTLEATLKAPFSVAVTSATAGDGKTALAVGLAQAFADAGYRTAIVDANPERSRGGTGSRDRLAGRGAIARSRILVARDGRGTRTSMRVRSPIPD